LLAWFAFGVMGESSVRSRPVERIEDAVVYTINESIHSEADLAAALQVPSDVLVRAWFKWRNASDYAKLAYLPPKARQRGALFGGGVTCSALYHGENGLSDAQVLDMATRGPDGSLVNAWGVEGCRHGSLSNPAYLEYVLSWCRKQIDAGVDYLFMDEINAVLQPNEGFDDYSLRDFRAFLLERFPDAKVWKEKFQADAADRRFFPDGALGSFDYRAYLKVHGWTGNPHVPQNPFRTPWHEFRRWRDDRAWKSMCDRLRAYAASKRRRVFLSANGLAPYVDLQVLGVWGLWRVKDGRIDLAESQLDDWAALVWRGRALARRRVPVVLFHDWGFGGFPWLEVSPSQRKLWIRIRGAEIYAAGALFAFPVHGPFGQDASQDGTLPEIIRQAKFYQQHQSLYLNAQVLGFEPLETKEPMLSLALWRRADPPALILHLINRQTESDEPKPRRQIAVRIPGVSPPKSVRIVSPDWPGQQQGSTAADNGGTTVIISELTAYAAAILEYDTLPEMKQFGTRIVPFPEWTRPERNEFIVEKDGTVQDAWALNAFLQGKLHAHLSNPPTFTVHMPKGGAVRVHVRAVAALGARLECLVDGRSIQTIELPDRDRKNDTDAREYDATYEFPIPPGRHRVTLQNSGADWLRVAWYAFTGELAE